jgi:hypothetical protein
VKEIERVQSDKKLRIVRPPLLERNMVVGFFDGASQVGGLRCGARAILKSLVLGNYSIKMNCGSGTNTRGELMALWIVLYLAHLK